jgi:UDP-2,3-diacylglucosamine hydrolase
MSDDSPNKYLFLSDLHLGGFSEDKNRQLTSIFFDLLQYLEDKSIQLVILGDLFDYYMQYRNGIPEHVKPVFERMHLFNQKAYHNIIYVTGNHDNWDIGYLESIGCITEHEYRILMINGEKVLIAHGDGLKDPTLGFKRPVFHRILRNPYFVQTFQAFTSIEMGNRIMKYFSRFSRFIADAEYNGPNLIDNWALKIITSSIADVVICGHHHKLMFADTGSGIYINTGAFFKQNCCVYYNNKQFQIVRWDVDQKNFNVIPSKELTLI